MIANDDELFEQDALCFFLRYNCLILNNDKITQTFTFNYRSILKLTT